MSPRARRAAVYAIAAVALWLASCGREYEWYQAGPQASRVEWRHVSVEAMYAICGQIPESFPNLGGCAVYAFSGGDCYVYSKYSEHDAHRVMSGDGLTLWEHEVGRPGKPWGHCNGWMHTSPTPAR